MYGALVGETSAVRRLQQVRFNAGVPTVVVVF